LPLLYLGFFFGYLSYELADALLVRFGLAFELADARLVCVRLILLTGRGFDVRLHLGEAGEGRGE